MGYATCTVTFSNGKVKCNPKVLEVSKAQRQDGVEWTFANFGYTFTGVTIDGVQAPTADFGTPQIGPDSAGRSVMSVSDSMTDMVTFFSYTLQYVDDKGRPGEHEAKEEEGETLPQIKNQN